MNADNSHNPQKASASKQPVVMSSLPLWPRHRSVGDVFKKAFTGAECLVSMRDSMVNLPNPVNNPHYELRQSLALLGAHIDEHGEKIAAVLFESESEGAGVALRVGRVFCDDQDKPVIEVDFVHTVAPLNEADIAILQTLINTTWTGATVKLSAKPGEFDLLLGELRQHVEQGRFRLHQAKIAGMKPSYLTVVPAPKPQDIGKALKGKRPSKNCVVCDKPGASKTCSRCRSAHYCSKVGCES